MKLRFTKSKDGKLRATVLLRERIGLDDLANAAAYVDSPSRTSLYNQTRHLLNTGGCNQEVEPDYETALHFFPELAADLPPRTQK